MQVMSGNEPLRWDPALAGAARLRFIINVLTRVRFVAADGTLEFNAKGTPSSAPPGLYPWFDVPGRRTDRHADRVRPLVHARPDRSGSTCLPSTPVAHGAAC